MRNSAALSCSCHAPNPRGRRRYSSHFTWSIAAVRSSVNSLCARTLMQINAQVRSCGENACYFPESQLKRMLAACRAFEVAMTLHCAPPKTARVLSRCNSGVPRKSRSQRRIIWSRQPAFRCSVCARAGPGRTTVEQRLLPHYQAGGVPDPYDHGCRSRSGAPTTAWLLPR